MAEQTRRRWQPTDLGVPGPTPRDMARAFRSVRADPLSFLVGVREQYGDLVAFPGAGPPALLLNDPADVRHVLQTSARSWGKQTVQYAALARVTGPGLLATSAPSWLEHRRLAAPAFHHRRLEAIGDQVRAAADRALGSWPSSTGPVTVDVAPLALRVALDVVGRALFSADLSGGARRLVDATSAAAELVVRVGRSVVPLPPWLPTPTNLRLRSATRRLDALSRRLVAERRGRDDAARGEDLLGLLLDSGLSDDEIRHELVTMVIAGHETVAAALAWALMLLAEDQEAQDRMRAELAGLDGALSMLGHRTSAPWSRAVVDETLRLFPPAWAISRRAAQDDVVAGRPVPAGTLAIISPWTLHRRRASWPEPETFDPQRFLGDPVGRADYLPFGLGPRLCIGREFALGEMVVVLSRLLAAYRFTVPDGWSRPAAEARVAVHPHGGMPLTLTRLAGPPGVSDLAPALALALALVAAALLARWLVSDLRQVPRGGVVADPPAVSVVVPARNEAGALPTLLASLARLETRVGEVVVVDDGSTDATAAVARAAGAVVVSATGPPAGWTGKAWACHLGARSTTGELLLFLDADTELAPDALAGLLVMHHRYGGLVSVQPFHRVVRPYEQLSAYFNVMSVLACGAFGRRPERRPTAFGPCLLTARADYQRAGGHAAVRGEILDDVSLAAAYGRAGLPVRCAVGGGALRMRMYPGGPRQLVEGWTKNFASGAAATDPRAAAGATLWLAAHHAVAVGVLLAGVAAATGWTPAIASGPPVVWAAAWVGFAWQLRTMLRRIGGFAWWTWALFPAPLVVFDVVFARSLALTVVRRSVRWRDRDVRVGGRGPDRPEDA